MKMQSLWGGVILLVALHGMSVHASNMSEASCTQNERKKAESGTCSSVDAASCDTTYTVSDGQGFLCGKVDTNCLSKSLCTAPSAGSRLRGDLHSWDFEESTGNFIDQGSAKNDLTAAVNNARMAEDKCKFGKCLCSNMHSASNGGGNNGVAYNNNIVWPTDGMTIATWFLAPSNCNAYQRLFDAGTAVCGDQFFSFWMPHGNKETMTEHMCNNGGDHEKFWWGNHGSSDFPSLDFTDGQWHSFVWRRTNAKQRGPVTMCVDGICKTKEVGQGNPPAATSLGLLLSYKGCVDDMDIWSRALTDAEMQAVMARSS